MAITNFCGFPNASFLHVAMIFFRLANGTGALKVHARQMRPQSLTMAIFDGDDVLPMFPLSLTLDGGPDDDVIYDHMPKAGGTFLIELFAAAVGEENLEAIREFHGLVEDNASSFTIGSIRNPCDYYVSLWAFGSKFSGKGKVGLGKYFSPGEHAKFYDVSATRDTPEDVSKFQQWLDYVSVQGHIGTMSLRMVASYSGDRELASSHIDGPASYYKANAPELLKRSEEVQANLDLSLVDCWVHMENIVDDAKVCLELWAAQGQDRKVDWEAFEKMASTPDRTSLHGSCERYYGAQMESLVRSIDHVVFQKFGYDKCCSTSTR